jgi:hypothetical protein
MMLSPSKSFTQKTKMEGESAIKLKSKTLKSREIIKILPRRILTAQIHAFL